LLALWVALLFATSALSAQLLARETRAAWPLPIIHH
jgi:hypothetical protein